MFYGCGSDDSDMQRVYKVWWKYVVTGKGDEYFNTFKITENHKYTDSKSKAEEILKNVKDYSAYLGLAHLLEAGIEEGDVE